MDTIMKSKSHASKIITNCKECIFSIYSDNTQTGCACGRIEAFTGINKVREAYDNDKEFYIIDSLCNLYRNKDWNNGDIDIDKAKDEVALSIDVLVDCQEMNDEYKERLIEYIGNAKYYHKKLKINLFYKYSSPSDVKSKTLQVFHEHKQDTKLYISSCANDDSYKHNYIVNTVGSYVALVTGKNFDIDLHNLINNIINQDLKRCLIIKFGDVFAISTSVYKTKSFETEKESYNHNMDAIMETIKDTEFYLEI